MIYLIITFLTFLITIVTTPYVINYLIKHNIVDLPDGEERHLHKVPIPRLGGIIIFAVILLITFIFYNDLYSKKFFISGAIIVFVLGVVDDIKGVKWQVKFIIQSFAAILLMISLNAHHFTVIKLLGFTLPQGLNYLVLFILIVGILNSFNLMDGLDGLVSGYALIIATMCFLMSIGGKFVFISYLSAAIIGTTLGYLKFNANPARIFLGDSGSLILGYFVAGLVISLSGEASASIEEKNIAFSNVIDLTFIIIVFAVPIADTLRVMLVRLRQKKNPFLPDTNHLHHILYSKKIRHKTVVVIIHLFSVLFVLLALYYAKVSETVAVLLSIMFVALLFNINTVLEFIIRKEHLLAYGKLYKKVPVLIPKLYKYIILPLVSVLLGLLFCLLIFNEVNEGETYYKYFLLFLIPSLLYSSASLRKNNYYAELLVLVNIILFFIITGFNGFFYKQYAFPFIYQININQIFIFGLSVTIILFILFKERIADLRQQFLNGTDLTIAVLIIFIYFAVQFINTAAPYKISDTLLRSFLVFLFYKMIIVIKPKIHFSLYYLSFLVAVIVIIKSLF